MFQWYRELLQIRLEAREAKRQIAQEERICQSCEVLKVELEKERREKQQLLAHILTPQTTEEPTRSDEPATPLRTARHVPWRVKQQQLELEDKRQRERILTEFRERARVPIDQMEKTMGIETNGKDCVIRRS